VYWCRTVRVEMFNINYYIFIVYQNKHYPGCYTFFILTFYLLFQLVAALKTVGEYDVRVVVYKYR